MKNYTNPGDEYATSLLNYPYLKELYKLVATDLSKKQALDVAHKIIQAINFTGNLKSWAK